MHDSNDRSDLTLAADLDAAALLGHISNHDALNLFRDGGDEAVGRWLTEHGLHGAWQQYQLDHGITEVCPDWCASDHDPVRLLTEGRAVSHLVTEVRAGEVTARVTEEAEVRDGQVVRGRYLDLTSERDTHHCLFVPLADVPDLLAVLGQVGAP